MSPKSLCHQNHCVTKITMSPRSLCHQNHYVTKITMSPRSLCHQNHYVTKITMSPNSIIGNVKIRLMTQFKACVGTLMILSDSILMRAWSVKSVSMMTTCHLGYGIDHMQLKILGRKSSK